MGQVILQSHIFHVCAWNDGEYIIVFVQNAPLQEHLLKNSDKKFIILLEDAVPP